METNKRLGPDRRSPKTPVRAPLFRGFRLALVVFTVIAVLLTISERRAAPGYGGGSPVPANPAQVVQAFHVVASGDTFWSIATRLAPGTDPRPLVDALVTAHGSSTLQVGERVRIPTGG